MRLLPPAFRYLTMLCIIPAEKISQRWNALAEESGSYEKKTRSKRSACPQLAGSEGERILGFEGGGTKPMGVG